MVSLVVCADSSSVCCSSGRFGACFLPALCKQSDLQVFAARPGLRLWRSDIRGQVEDTRLLKPLFNTQVRWEHTENIYMHYSYYCYYSNRYQILLLELLLLLLLLLYWQYYCSCWCAFVVSVLLLLLFL